MGLDAKGPPSRAFPEDNLRDHRVLRATGSIVCREAMHRGSSSDEQDTGGGLAGLCRVLADGSVLTIP